MERQLAERRAEWQAEHFQRAAEQLKNFEAMRTASPGLSVGRVLEAVALTLAQFRKVGAGQIPADYDTDRVSWKVAKIILSYTDYVNRRVFQKM